MALNMAEYRQRAKRSYGPAQKSPWSVQQGRLASPDTVQSKFGGFEGLQLYGRMYEQNAYLAGKVDERIDRVVEIDRQIVPGDPTDERSQELAAEAKVWWTHLPNKDIFTRELVRGFYYGHGPAEKLFADDGAPDPWSGLLAPCAVRGIVPWALKFGPEDEEYFVTDFQPNGIPIEPGKTFRFLWGSTWSAYGDAEARPLYLPCWFTQQVQEFGLKAIEQFGRPVPVCYYPADWAPSRVDEYDTALAEDYEIYLLLPSDTKEPKTSLLSEQIASQGSAGRSEWAFIANMERWISVRLSGSAQSSDSSGARASEETKDKRTDLKTPTASRQLDECLTRGLLDDISARNWPTLPREIWPRFDSDTTEINEEKLTGTAAEKADLQIMRVIAHQTPASVAVEIIAGVGVPRARAERMVAAALQERDTLERDPVISGITVKPVAPPVDNPDAPDE